MTVSQNSGLSMGKEGSGDWKKTHRGLWGHCQRLIS